MEGRKGMCGWVLCGGGGRGWWRSRRIEVMDEVWKRGGVLVDVGNGFFVCVRRGEDGG